MRLMEWGFLRRIRQHHAIEHATINILTQRNPRRHLVARSDQNGFYVYGPVETDELQEAVSEALRRLQAGEHDLAIHPHCGTNIVTAGVMAGLTGVLITAGQRRRWWEQLPLVLAATTLALLAAQPIGYLAQERVTTLADVQGVRLSRVECRSWGGAHVHRVDFTREPAR